MRQLLVVPLLLAATANAFAQFNGQPVDKGQHLRTCTLLGSVTEAVIDVQRADKQVSTYDVLIEFDGIKIQCPFNRDVSPEVANCGTRVKVALRDSAVEHIAVFGTPSKITVALSENGKEVAKRSFKPDYKEYFPNGSDCPPGYMFWRTLWTISH